MALFEITRRGTRQPRSLTLPATPYPEGTALQESATAGVAELADGTKPVAGFMTRASLAALPVPSMAEMLGQGSQPLESEFLASKEGAVEDADEVIAEGADHIYSGTGQITALTALKSKVGLKDGKFRVAQSTEYAEFILVELPAVTVATNGVRARFERTRGVVV